MERKSSSLEETGGEHAIESLESGQENLATERYRKVSEGGRRLIFSIRKSRGSGNYSVPKHIITVDEKYILRCLESIRSCAVRAASWNFTSKPDTSLGRIKNENSSNIAIKYSLGNETEVIVESSDDWTVSGSQAMINILKSPLLRRLGSDGMDNFGAPLHKRDTSILCSNSSVSDQSSSCYGTSFQGMLQYTWKGGLPHHVFTLDDKREVYIANLSMAESSQGKDFDYLYTFYLRRSGNTEVEVEPVAKMRVSTLITLSSNNLEVRETHFVLSSVPFVGETRVLSRVIKKKSLLARRVVDVFRPHKPRLSPSVHEKSNFDDSLSDQCEEVVNQTNLELAAIVVKESKEVEVGGWGLKFLKKTRNNTSLESSNKDGECSTSMDALIPTGYHCGPTPATLIERWTSGGYCDCGGWDIGCPLKILSTPLEQFGECESVDLFMQGSKQSAPVLKMVNIHKGLYYVNFQSTVSALQSFAISAAMLHIRDPVLRPETRRS